MKNFREKIAEYSEDKSYEKEWYIFHSESHVHQKKCICGHFVKRVTYIYNKETQCIMYIGTTCAKKYGITQHLNNSILISVLKEVLYIGEWDDNVLKGVDLFSYIKKCIQVKYIYFCNNICDNNAKIDYYGIVAPFRRLLNDVCDLVSDYKYDFILLLQEIEKDVESMNMHVKHIMVDEYSADEDSLNEIDYNDVDEMSAETPSEVSDDVIEEYTKPFMNENCQNNRPNSPFVNKDEIMDDKCDKNEIYGEQPEAVASSSAAAYSDIHCSEYDSESSGIQKNNAYCSRNSHCNCVLFYRMENKINDVEKTRNKVRRMREETASLKKGIEELRKNIANMNTTIYNFNKYI